jgi:hypothetical protein
MHRLAVTTAKGWRVRGPLRHFRSEQQKLVRIQTKFRLRKPLTGWPQRCDEKELTRGSLLTVAEGGSGAALAGR